MAKLKYAKSKTFNNLRKAKAFAADMRRQGYTAKVGKADPADKFDFKYAVIYWKGE